MKFKLDENLPAIGKAIFKEHGHDLHTVYDECMAGATDSEIFNRCRREGRIIITLDLDFADIRSYPPSESPGIIVLRLARQDKNSIIDTLQRLLPLIKFDAIAQKLWIVEETLIRVRE